MRPWLSFGVVVAAGVLGAVMLDQLFRPDPWAPITFVRQPPSVEVLEQYYEHGPLQTSGWIMSKFSDGRWWFGVRNADGQEIITEWRWRIEMEALP